MPVVAGTVYATTTDLQRLGMLGAALSTMDANAQTEALQYGSAVADSFLQGQYILPLQTWGYDLVGAVCAIAAWTLLSARGYNPQANSDEGIYRRNLDSLKWLDEVSKGLQTPVNVTDSSSAIGGAPGAEESAIDGGSLTTTSVRGWTDRGVGSPSTWPGTTWNGWTD